MVFEIAEIEVKPGQEAAFEAAVAEAGPNFRGAKGCLSLELQRTVERPTVYRLVVGWESVESHTVDFRNSEGFQTWRKLAGPYFAAPPKVEHTRVAVKAF